MKKLIYALIMCFVAYAGPANVSIILCEKHENICCVSELESFLNTVYRRNDDEHFNICLKLRELLSLIHHLQIDKFYIFISFIDFFNIFNEHKRFYYKYYATQGKMQGICYNIQDFFNFLIDRLEYDNIAKIYMIEDKSFDSEVAFYTAQSKYSYNVCNLLVSARIFFASNSFKFHLSKNDLDRIKNGGEFMFVRNLSSQNLLELDFFEFLDVV